MLESNRYLQSMTLPEKKDDTENQQQEVIEPEDDWATDEQFNRLRRMTELLIEQAQRALSYQIVTDHHHRRSANSRRHRQYNNYRASSLLKEKKQ